MIVIARADIELRPRSAQATCAGCAWPVVVFAADLYRRDPMRCPCCHAELWNSQRQETCNFLIECGENFASVMRMLAEPAA